ncbi:MAG: ribosome small subunit-dependent GTPase A [Acidobacteria bacterium]|nr:ribosome small subunit-dependent GTPase A [Acidobacteriota bacterium]
MSFRITAQHRGFWMVNDLPATLAGSFDGPRPCVGDWVELRETQIVAVAPRKTLFARKAAGSGVEVQAIAANVDIAFLVMALDHDFSLRRLERYLVLARESGTRPVVLLTKADLAEDVAGSVAAVRGVLDSGEIEAIAAVHGHGVEQVRRYLPPGITAVLLGSSGAGKSTLINALLGEERMATQPVRQADSKGRHTTTHRELLELPGGAFLIDTPGMRELQLWATGESVNATFGDIGHWASQCRFSDCSHSNEPGCAVRQAVADGLLDPERLGSLHKLRREAEYLAVQTDVHQMLARKAKWKSIHKAMRNVDKRR